MIITIGIIQTDDQGLVYETMMTPLPTCLVTSNVWILGVLQYVYVVIDISLF